jgi:predicted secreted protein
MAAQGRFNAKDMKVYTTASSTDTLIAHVDSCEINFSAETIDITTKDSNGWKEIIHGLKSGSASISGKTDFSSSNQVGALTTAFTAGTALTFKFKTANVGDTTYSWTGYITSLPLMFGNNEAATFSCDVEFSGSPTIATLSA